MWEVVFRPWRAFYARVGDTFVIAAVGPETQVDERGFDRAVAAATERLRQSTEER
jgi:hypothetical protein